MFALFIPIILPTMLNIAVTKSIPLRDAEKNTAQIINGMKINPAMRSIRPNANAHPAAVNNAAAQTQIC